MNNLKNINNSQQAKNVIKLSQMKKDKSVVEGVITEALPNTQFRVVLEKDKRELLCHLSGKMRINRIRVMPGDQVKVELTPFDENRGRIVYRIR